MMPVYNTNDNCYETSSNHYNINDNVTLLFDALILFHVEV